MEDLSRLQALFDEAVQLEGEAREAFLRSACGEDEALREELLALLSADDAHDTLRPSLSVDPDALDADRFDAQLEGTELGSYRLLRRIGAGGMGTVFLAERSDGAFERQVAIKVVRRGMDTELVLQRFVAERQILSRLDHPNISALLDGGVTPDGRPYLVMEYVDGVPITEYCDAHQLSIGRRLALFQSVCRAVHHAHRNLVVHRDLKPSNILVTERGEVKLLDFGIAKLIDDAEDPGLTRTGMQALTPAYASPEQLTGEAITTGTDVYALGVILYELLAGRRPFEALRTPDEMRAQVLSGEAPKPSTAITKIPGDADGQKTSRTLETISASRSVGPGRLRQALSGDLDTICLMAIRRDPGQRYGSAEQLAEDLGRHLEGQPVQAQAPSLAYRFGKFVRRHRAGVATTAAVLLAFAGVIGFYTHQLQQERDSALAQQARAEAVTAFLTDLFFEADPYQARGEDITARQILEAGRESIEDNLVDQPELQAIMKKVLGQVYYTLGNLPVAEELLRSAFAYQTAGGGLDAADSRLTLGFIEQDRGEYDAATASLQYVYDQRVAALGPVHESVREAVAAQAFLQETLGNFDEAEVLHQRNFEMAQTLFSGDHLTLAKAYSELGNFYHARDQTEAAEALFRDGLAMMERLFDEGRHPLTGIMKRQLGELLRDVSRFDESEPYLREAIDLQTEMLGPDNYEVGVSWNALSQLYSKIGRNTEALEANQTMIGILEKVFDGPSPALGAGYNNLAFMLADEGRFEEALEYFDRSIAVQDAIGLPEDHFNRTFPSSGKAEMLVILGQPEAAERIWRDMLVIRLEVLGEDHRLTNEMRSDLGAVLTELGALDEAESLLRPAFEHFLATAAPDTLNRREATERMVALFEARGDKERAERYRLEGSGEGDGVSTGNASSEGASTETRPTPGTTDTKEAAAP